MLCSTFCISPEQGLSQLCLSDELSTTLEHQFLASILPVSFNSYISQSEDRTHLARLQLDDLGTNLLEHPQLENTFLGVASIKPWQAAFAATIPAETHRCRSECIDKS